MAKISKNVQWEGATRSMVGEKERDLSLGGQRTGDRKKKDAANFPKVEHGAAHDEGPR
jgi:hypothetical protein